MQPCGQPAGVACRLRMLRVFLAFSGAVWGVSWVGAFVRWETAASLLQGMGAQPIAFDPLLDYWLRMAASAFGLIGCWYLVLAIWPSRFQTAIPWFGWLMIVEGLVLLVHGLRLGLAPFPFYGDVGACFLGGGGILGFAKAAKSNPASFC